MVLATQAVKKAKKIPGSVKENENDINSKIVTLVSECEALMEGTKKEKTDLQHEINEKDKILKEKDDYITKIENEKKAIENKNLKKIEDLKSKLNGLHETITKLTKDADDKLKETKAFYINKEKVLVDTIKKLKKEMRKEGLASITNTTAADEENRALRLELEETKKMLTKVLTETAMTSFRVFDNVTKGNVTLEPSDLSTYTDILKGHVENLNNSFRNKRKRPAVEHAGQHAAKRAHTVITPRQLTEAFLEEIKKNKRLLTPGFIDNYIKQAPLLNDINDFYHGNITACNIMVPRDQSSGRIVVKRMAGVSAEKIADYRHIERNEAIGVMKFIIHKTIIKPFLSALFRKTFIEKNAVGVVNAEHPRDMVLSEILYLFKQVFFSGQHSLFLKVSSILTHNPDEETFQREFVVKLSAAITNVIIEARSE